MEEPVFIINTTMSKEDYRKFLYIATFKRNKFMIPFICLIALLGGIIISFQDGIFNLAQFLISWFLLFILAIGVVLFKVERKNSQRIKTDQTGTFDSINTLRFFQDRIVMENKSLKSYGELKYEQFYTIIESKDYFIFYFTANQASLVRAKDVENLDEFRKFIIGVFADRYRKI
jgi:hypothetical protein